MAAKDLTGRRFGRLVAIRVTEERRNRCVVWLCECDCGKKTKVSSNSLSMSHTKSCGCLQKEKVAKLGRKNMIDLTGKRFGRLVIIKRVPSKTKRKRVAWLCKCDCGNKCVVIASHITCGVTRSCGCLWEDVVGAVNNLVGRRFGRLVVIRHIGKGDRRRHVWECICDCGNKSCIEGGNLTIGQTTSCGCFKAAKSMIRGTPLSPDDIPYDMIQVVQIWGKIKRKLRNIRKGKGL